MQERSLTVRPVFSDYPFYVLIFLFVMKAILQRVVSASVTVDTHIISSIGKGILVFAAIASGDSRTEVESMATKVLKLKMWPDEAGGTWKKSVQDIQGEVLCVSQFTLLASTKKGSKPDFHDAADIDKAKELYDLFFARVQELYDPAKVKDGVFQAMMQVKLVNDGPVGIDYRSDDGAVTLEIQTNPPKAVDKSKTSTHGGDSKISENFEMPSSLLE